MEQEFNTTANLENFSYEPSNWEIAGNYTLLFVSLVAICADILIVYMVARHKKMHNKTNLIIMNIAINDALFLIFNVSDIIAISQSLYLLHLPHYLQCLISFTGVSFQLNVIMLVSVLISNFLLKRVERKWLFAFVYTLTILTTLANIVLCHYNSILLLLLVTSLVQLFNGAVLIFKEFNACYKRWWKKDPLSEATKFRLNIARIYICTIWIVVALIVMFGGTLLYIAHIFGHSIAVYILIYIVCADKNFKICFLNVLKCGDANKYNVDATITFSEDLCDIDEKQVNISYNNTTASNNV